MDDLEQLRSLKMSHNTLVQRATTALALAEIIQDYRLLATQLLAQNEKLIHENNNLRQARIMVVPDDPKTKL